MRKIVIILFLICFTATGCTPGSKDSIETPLYQGKTLKIGVIGTPPEIRETNVRLEEITFAQLAEADLSSGYHAIFIMKEHLVEAAKPQYAHIYESADIPFFYMESKKSYIPFLEKNLSYEEVPDLSADMYATGYYQREKEYQSWGYGLYNDKVNKTNIEDVYTRIFSTIEPL